MNNGPITLKYIYAYIEKTLKDMGEYGTYGKIRAIEGIYTQIRVIKPEYSQIYW